jgi:cysteine desulfurase family protein (TIGR01976 family)
MTGANQDLDVEAIRAMFPALNRREHGHPVAYLDGPGGTQVPQTVIDAMSAVLGHGVSNLGGGFGASHDAEEAVTQARAAMADFCACDPSEISFGQNMTSITFAVSRALSRSWRSGDAIVLTSLDHDANFTPWVRAAEDNGVEVRIAEFDPTTGTLEPEAVARVLDDRVRLVATCVASNAIGSIVDVEAITRVAHEAGALVYLDAVHAGPHRLLDVRSIDCDFLVVSSYKFFGPHTGILFGKLDLLAELDFYKVRPAPSDPPDKLETGTQSFESIAGVTAAVEYLAGLGDGEGRRARLESGYRRIAEHETNLGQRFIEGVAGLDRVAIHGAPSMGGRRVATFAISVDGMAADDVAARLSAQGIYVWSGHYYALNAIERLGFLEAGGLARIGFVHYNTVAEVDRCLEALVAL